MKHLNPKETAQFLRDQPDALLIDCRSEIEDRFVSHPVGAHHVPWSDAPDWEINPRFVEEVRQLAGLALEAAGFTDVINVLHGFEGQLNETRHRGALNGWRFDGLPWEQS